MPQICLFDGNEMRVNGASAFLKRTRARHDSTCRLMRLEPVSKRRLYHQRVLIQEGARRHQRAFMEVEGLAVGRLGGFEPAGLSAICLVWDRLLVLFKLVNVGVGTELGLPLVEVV